MKAITLKKIWPNLLLLTLIASLLASCAYLLSPVTAGAIDVKDGVCQGVDNLQLKASKEVNDQDCKQKGFNDDAGAQAKLNDLIKTVINVFTIIVGIIAVIMIIYGGLKFITSSGDAGRVTSAKQTIIYAIIGLIIAALAQFITRFILSATPGN